MDLINKFNEDGYIVIPNLISEHEIKNYKKMLESYHKKIFSLTILTDLKRPLMG